MNNEVYRSTVVPRTYLVLSTSAGVDQAPPKPERGFAATPAFGQLVDELAAAHAESGGQPVPVTLNVHGYNTRRGGFERELVRDGEEGGGAGYEGLRPDRRFLIGFRWPSEGLASAESWLDTLRALFHSPAVGLLLVLFPFYGLLVSGDLDTIARPFSHALAAGIRWLAQLTVTAEASILLWIAERWPSLASFLRTVFSPFAGPTAGAIWLGAGALILGLRLSTYPRDRYRALHYGVPDLGEFFKVLERELVQRGVKVHMDVVGHSMGSLLLINCFRGMADFFHDRDDPGAAAMGAGAAGGSYPYDSIGRARTFRLGSLILCAPDIPAVMAAPDHNNYFQSALRRFRSVHVFSSDRDLILKWLSPIANWFSEPRFDMAGRKLGNVLLVRRTGPPLKPPDSRIDWKLWPVNRPVLGSYQVYPRDPVSSSRPADVHFHDCTLDRSVCGSYLSMLAASAVVTGVLLAGHRWSANGLLGWMAAILGASLALGLVARPLWPALRDRGLVGGIAGALAEVPTLMTFVTLWRGWNPHSGYFMRGEAPRRRLCAILQDPDSFPPVGADGQRLEEQDGPIRYRRVSVSV